MLTLICALDEQRAIGLKGHMLFRLRSDLQRFKALTVGHTVIMGRKTFASLPKGALPNRRNFVVSRSLSEAPAGTFLFVLPKPHSRPHRRQRDLRHRRIFNLRNHFAAGRSTVFDTHSGESPSGRCVFPGSRLRSMECTFHESHPADEQNEQPYIFADYIRI